MRLLSLMFVIIGMLISWEAVSPFGSCLFLIKIMLFLTCMSCLLLVCFSSLSDLVYVHDLFELFLVGVSVRGYH